MALQIAAVLGLDEESDDDNDELESHADAMVDVQSRG